MTEVKTLRWGIIGPGGIAQKFRDGVAGSRHGKLVAIATRDPRRKGLGETFPGARIVNGYQAILTDPEVDAVYIATPHPFHAEWAIRCAGAGKHVLIEKPMGLSAYQADAMFNAASKAGTFMGEAFMYRPHPMTLKLLDVLKDGVIGDIRLIRSSFGFSVEGAPATHRLLDSALAGGGIMDVGCYPVSMVRLIAGVALGLPFADPVKVQGSASIGKTGIDDSASALLEFAGGIRAEVSCSVMVPQDNVLHIMGGKGRIEVSDFWFASGVTGGTGTIRVFPRNGEPSVVEFACDKHLYSFEADGVATALAGGKTEFAWPGMSQADSLGNLRVLDKWRRDAGLVFAPEQPKKSRIMISGRELTWGRRIPERAIAGLAKKASSIAIGFEDFPDMASAAILLDAFMEAGGNIFDTGFIYGGGVTEKVLGQWLKSRGVRQEAIIIAKGAHSPLVYPDVIGKQLTVSLDRLQTGHADIYFMHRDNPDVPVGEFVDAMDAEVKAGRIKGPFGGSNWTRKRMDEAIAWANKHGRTAPSVLSNNFSLADMIDPIWDGCVSASTRDWTGWMLKNSITNFAWSSQARGFFTDRAGVDKLADADLARCWYSKANFARRERAIDLASQLGTTPIRIALAYVLAQQAGIVPLIGPRRLVELEDSLHAVDLRLTAEQVAWLRGQE